MAPRCKYDLVAFDLDGTLADGLVYVWQLLHERFGCDMEARARAREEFFAGLISYQRWFEHDLELLQARGATRRAMIEALAEQARPTEGAKRVLETLKDAGVTVAVISGSIDVLLDALFPDFPFDHVLINRLEFDAEGRLTGGEHTRFDLAGKAEGLAHLAALEGTTPDRCAFVGDNENDIDVLRLAGLGVAFQPRTERVAAAADVVLRGPDLTPVLDYLMA